MIMQHSLSRVLRLALLFGLLASAIAAQASTRNILVLGDSISAGYGMSLEQGWVALLAEELEEDFPGYAVINASISGETSGGGLRRLPALLTEHDPAVVVIELGGNDGLRGYPVNALRDNLRKMATISADPGARVVPKPVAIPPNYGRRYTDAFSASFPAVARETDSTLTPMIYNGVGTNPELMQPDGIHPTAEAQPLMLNNIRSALLTVLETL